MSSVGSPAPPASAKPRWRDRSPLAVIPSWLMSLVLHTALLVFFATRLWTPTAKDAHSGEQGGFREVGIVVKTSQGQSESVESQSQAAPSQTSVAQPTASLQPPSLAEVAPIPLSLPDRDPLPTIGAGSVAPPALAGSDLGTLVQPGAGKPSTGGGVPGRGNVAFSGLKDNATQVVYLVDCSHSMEGEPLREVKQRLMQSLAQLSSTQRFQIIFYNDRPHPLTIRTAADGGLYWATDLNKTQARQFIEGRPASGGTNHYDALKAALRLSPEVLYFLTDAEGGLTSREMNEIRQLNKGTRIHCIEFGDKLPDPDSSLKRLAHEHNGSYTWQDTMRLRRP